MGFGKLILEKDRLTARVGVLEDHMLEKDYECHESKVGISALHAQPWVSRVLQSILDTQVLLYKVV